LHEHAARLKELEQRLTHSGVLLEQERDRCLQLNNHADSLKSELQQLNAANATLQEHMQSLGHAERMVAELSVRMSELADANRDLTAQLNVKTSECGQHQETINAINREKLTMSVCVDRYESQLRARDEAVKSYESKVESMQKDIDRLQQRQINPDLERTIRFTQNLLQMPGQSTGEMEAFDDNNPQFQTSGSSRLATAHRMQGHGNTDFANSMNGNLSQLYANSNGSVRNTRNSEVSDENQFERFTDGNARTSDYISHVPDREQFVGSVHSELHEMLQQQQVPQHQQHQLQFQPNYVNGHHGSYSQTGFIGNASMPSAASKGTYFPSRQGVMNIAAPVDDFRASNQLLYASGGVERAPNTPPQLGQRALSFSGINTPSSFAHYPAGGPTFAGASGYEYNIESGNVATAGAAGNARLHLVSAAPPSLSPTQSAASAGSSLQARLPVRQSQAPPAAPSLAQANISNHGVSTPVTAQSPSVRFSKLGTDLQALAKKLDSYEGKKK
jgi:predicted nuclease with TOPRIM domain